MDMELENKGPEYELVELLIKKGFRITFAESCTAGLVASRIVNVPDASKVLDVSFVTYANEAKVKYVGVNPDTIEKHGVVSPEVALEMAKGAAAAMGAEVGVGISGIAGPTGGTPQKPVGMVCFGIYMDGEEFSFTEQFGDMGRNNVREESVKYIISQLIKILNSKIA